MLLDSAGTVIFFEPAGRALHPQLANLLDDHDESLSARCSAGTGVHQAGTTSAGRAAERQIYRPAQQDTLRLSHQGCAAWRLPRQSERSSTGNMVMWRGLSRLTDIELGATIGAQLVGN